MTTYFKFSTSNDLLFFLLDSIHGFPDFHCFLRAHFHPNFESFPPPKWLYTTLRTLQQDSFGLSFCSPLFPSRFTTNHTLYFCLWMLLSLLTSKRTSFSTATFTCGRETSFAAF